MAELSFKPEYGDVIPGAETVWLLPDFGADGPARLAPLFYNAFSNICKPHGRRLHSVFNSRSAAEFWLTCIANVRPSLRPKR